MTDPKYLMRVLLLTCPLLTGVRCRKEALFVYRTPHSDVLLPCTNLLSLDCSRVSWTFSKMGQMRYTQEVTGGRVRPDSDKFSRMSVTANCSLHLRDLRVEDAGAYVCLESGSAVSSIYVSLLTITSSSSISDLQPGGNLTLNCILFTYYDAGSCRSYSSVFNLSWAAEDGTELPEDSRYKLIGHSRCNITLVTNLQPEDNNRKWRCQVSVREVSRATFLDFTSTFLFENPPTAQNLIPSAAADCPLQLPISRIMLCLSLPVMLIVVGLFTRKKTRVPAGAVELRDTD